MASVAAWLAPMTADADAARSRLVGRLPLRHVRAREPRDRSRVRAEPSPAPARSRSTADPTESLHHALVVATAGAVVTLGAGRYADGPFPLTVPAGVTL